VTTHTWWVSVLSPTVGDVPTMQIFTTPIYGPVPLVHFSLFVMIAAALRLASGAISHKGRAEMWAFRKFGDVWKSRLGFVLKWSAAFFLVFGAWWCTPKITWQITRLPSQVFAAAVLVVLAITVIFTGAVVEWLARLRALGWMWEMRAKLSRRAAK